jgi:transglutaminase-like putative cysteine protease
VTTTERLLAAAPLAIAACLYAWVTQSPTVAILVGAALVVAIPLSPRVDAPPFVQRATLLLVGLFSSLGGGAALRATELEVPTRPRAFLGVAAVTLLLLGGARRFFRDPEGGARVDFGVATLVVVACGQKRLGHVYVEVVVVFVIACVAMLRSRDRESGWSVVEVHAPWAGAGVLLIVGALSGVGVVALPRLARLTQHQFDRFVLPTDAARVGYTDRLRTGSPDALVESDAIVLRVYGPHVDYLRGRVYDAFDLGSWDSTRGRVPVPITTLAGKPAGPQVVEIRGVGAFVTPSVLARFFVPLGARRIVTEKGKAMVDELGTFRPAEDEPPSPIAFELGAPAYPVAAPTDVDLHLSTELRSSLDPLARGWTVGASSAREKVEALERHLRQDFTYTLDGAPPSRSAILHFLFVTRRGRCELFATALALLGRELGIPTRVVGGFRVAEHNAVGGYDLVREKNAHAWVEAWVDGSWTTFDPTPPTEANTRRDAPAVGAFGDAVLAAYDRAVEWLARFALWQLGAVLGAAVSLLTIVRVARLRRERRQALRGEDAAGAPLPYFGELLATLGEAGFSRAASEPLERFAERLRAANLGPVADVVLEYAAFRYGGIGDGESLARRVRAAASLAGDAVAIERPDARGARER